MATFPTINRGNLRKLRAILRSPGNKTFLVTTHVNPDPDALCSQLAVALFLKVRGKKVILLNHEEIPSRLNFLPHSHLIKSVKGVTSVHYDAAVAVDCGDLPRVGDVQSLLDPAKPLINIDHHITNDGFGTCRWIDPQASSTCEILFDLFQSLKMPLTKPLAQLLYAGIMGDTGGFRYDNTTAKTHRIAAALQEFRLSPADYYRKIYESIPVADLQKFIRIMNRFEFFADGRIVSLTLSEKVFDSFSEDFDLKDSVFRFLRSIKNVEVSLIFMRIGRSKTRVNLRSAGVVDVAAVALHFNGGGHRNASGCTVDRPAKDVKTQILQEIQKALP